MDQSSSSVWRQAAVAVAGGAVAGVLLATVAPAFHVNNFAPSTSSTANAVFASAPVAYSGVRPISTPVFAAESAQGELAIQQSSTWQPQVFAPILLATSGLLMVIAAAIRFFRPAQNLEYSMLLATAQQQRLRATQEKEEAKKREIQERLMRLARMGALPSHISVPSTGAVSVAPATPSPAPATFSSNNEWESRQTQRQRQEQQKEEAKRREIQERLARLAAMGFTAPSPAPVASSAPKAVQVQAPAPTPVAAPTGSISDWEQRQQERERREREKEAAKQREIQERLARLAKLGAAVPQQAQPAAVAVEGVNEWERRQQERERREREKAMAAQREIEERMARLARLSSGR